MERQARKSLRRRESLELLPRHYDRVAKFRRTGLAEVRDQKCMGCQVVLRPQTYNEVRSGVMVICESCQRILYFDPKAEIVLERPSLTAKRRARPKTHIDRAWFYRSDFGETGEVFIAFANANGNASRRVYDAHTGRKIGETLYEEGDFAAKFPGDIRSGVQLRSGLDEQQLEEWAAELPMIILDELHGDLKAAQVENPSEETQPTEHPAAS